MKLVKEIAISGLKIVGYGSGLTLLILLSTIGTVV